MNPEINHSEMFVASWHEDVSKSAGTALRSAGSVWSGARPKIGLKAGQGSMHLRSPGSMGRQTQLNNMMAPYKGGVAKPDKKLPFQAAKTKAALARRKNTTQFPFGNAQ